VGVITALHLIQQIPACRLLSLCAGHLGSVAANTVRVFKPDQLPLLLIISRSRGIAEVVQVLHGTSVCLIFLITTAWWAHDFNF